MTPALVNDQVGAGQSLGASAPPAVVLVVDDSEGNRYAAVRWLEQAGFRVVQATSGADALSLVSCGGAELVLLDVNLPDIDGFEVARRIRADQRTAHLPVLHLSAERVASGDRVTGLDAGADAYLTHPIEPAELVASVRALLRLSIAERSLRERNQELEAAVEDARRAHEAVETQAAQLRTAAAELATRTALAERQQRFATAVFDAMADAHFVLDRELRFVSVNAAAERKLGHTAAELLGHTHRELFPTNDGERTLENYRRVATERTEAHFGHRVLRDGVARYFEIDVYPTEEGGVAVFARDVSERERLLDAERAAASRTLLLQEITAALARTITRDESGRAVLSRVMPTFGATIGSLALLTPDGATFEVMGVINGVPAVTARWSSFQRALETPNAAAVAAAAPISAWTGDELAARFPVIVPTLADLGVRSVWCVRLDAADRVLGTMDLCFADARTPTADESSLLVAVSQQCAVALQRADYADAERRAAERTARLQRLTEALSDARTIEDVSEAAVVHGALTLGAIGTVVALLQPDGETLEIVRARDMPIDERDSWHRFPLAASAPLADVARTGEPLFLESLDDWGAAYPDLRSTAEAAGHRANAVLPLLAHGATVGAMGVAFNAPRRFDDDERALALTAARLCAQAIERARLFDAERAARAEAEKANRAKSEFLAVMSHELRTPLNAIGGYAELIEMGIRGPVTDAQREDLARIQKSQRHLLGLINGVLNYARVEGGHLQYEVADVPVDEVLATAEALIAPQVRGKSLTLRFDGCSPDIRARADREKVQQIVLNLLSNAVKFTEPGGTITMGCEQARADVLISVADTGHGIGPEQSERVFQPFVQVDARLARTQEGVGLGLAISRDLAHGMGGDLTLASELGRGSTFILRLPPA